MSRGKNVLLHLLLLLFFVIACIQSTASIGKRGICGKPLDPRCRVFVVRNKSPSTSESKSEWGKEREGHRRQRLEEASTQTQDAPAIDPYRACAAARFGTVRKGPVENGRADFHRTVTSACARCGACLAIANQINQTLVGFSEKIDRGCMNDREIEALLRNVCDYSFKHYRLREIEGQRFIGDRIPGSSLVPSSVNDDQWETHLREKCREYLREIGPKEILRFWKEIQCDAAEDRTCRFLDKFCRNDAGSLRDCRNIPRNTSTTGFPSCVRFVGEYVCA